MTPKRPVKSSIAEAKRSVFADFTSYLYFALNHCRLVAKVLLVKRNRFNELHFLGTLSREPSCPLTHLPCYTEIQS